ncbi:MAG TPA: NlpC/P60 family protein [Micromonosporaceae bacterium]|jgi:cell wall-associated NlpC family hydrolase
MLLLASTLAMVGVLAAGVPAQATPSASDLSKQIQAKNNQIETDAEKINGAKVQLSQDQKTQTKVVAQIAPLQLRASVASRQLGTIAAELYKSGAPHPTLEALLGVTSTQAMLNQVGALNEIAHRRKASVDVAAKQVTQYTSQKKKLDALVAKDKVLVAQLAAEKKTVEGQLASLQKLQAKQDAKASAQGAGGTGSSKFSHSYVTSGGEACPQSSAGGKGHTAAVKACSLLWPVHMYRIDYAGPTYYDCSGLTMTAWKAAGVTLDHWTGAKHAGQWAESHHIARADLLPGDLVFYNSGNHVAMYVGNGWIVQAEETGQPVKMSKLDFETPVDYRRVNAA